MKSVLVRFLFTKIKTTIYGGGGLYSFINGLFVGLSALHKLAQGLIGCRGHLLSQICVKPPSHLLHRVMGLCCGLGPIGLLVWFMAGHGRLLGTRSYLPSIQPYVCAACDLSKSSKPNWPLIIFLFT